jgi:hypothetical protein
MHEIRSFSLTEPEIFVEAFATCRVQEDPTSRHLLGPTRALARQFKRLRDTPVLYQLLCRSQLHRCAARMAGARRTVEGLGPWNAVQRLSEDSSSNVVHSLAPGAFSEFISISIAQT